MKIGLIAGWGELPSVFRKKASEKGHEVFTIGVRGITDSYCDEKISLGKVERLVQIFQKKGINKLVMLGKFEHKLIFSHFIFMDDLTREILRNSKDRRPESLIRAFMDKLESLGFEFIDPKPFLEDILAQQGPMTDLLPSEEAMQDGLFGFSIAKQIAELDIGQTIVVKNKSVVSVEAMEGTQETILRAGKLAGPGCRVVKVARKNQDFRIDVPTVGPDTLEAIKKIRGDALFLESGKVYIVNKERFLMLAKRYSIAVYGL